MPFRYYLWIATFFGTGYAPKAPGTVGTFAALPVYFILRRLGLLWYCIFVLILSVVGVVASTRVERSSGMRDPSYIVIDEVCGILTALVSRPRDLLSVFVATLLFRAFDILKPPPVGTLEKKLPGGLGIMADDLAAGAISACILSLIMRKR